MAGKRIPLETRFWNKVNKTDGCWVWTAATQRYGYGVVHIGGTPTNLRPAHRVSWEMAHGPIPSGLYVLHKCDNPPCVRPDHLFLGTPKDNNDDCARKLRHSYTVPGDIVLEVRRRYAAGETQMQIAACCGLSQSYVSKIVRGQVRKYVG